MSNLDTNQSKSNNYFGGFKWGLIASCLPSIIFIYFSVKKDIISHAPFIFPIVISCLLLGCFSSIIYLREKIQLGKLSFTDGFKIGMQTSIGYAIIISITIFICQTIIYPEFPIDAIAFAKEKGIKEHVSPEKIKQILGYMKQDISIGSQITKFVFAILVVGAFSSFLFSGLLRKD